MHARVFCACVCVFRGCGTDLEILDLDLISASGETANIGLTHLVPSSSVVLILLGLPSMALRW